MLTSLELRKKYLDFFGSKGHKIIPSASLIPENDPTVLFTTAGMHPLVPYLLGQAHPEGTRLTNVQKCVRTQDIDEVGDNRHQTFFEMLGNWSLGDYFKEDAIKWSYEFLTSPQYLGLDKRKLAVTVFAGENETNIPRDNEAAEIWKGCGMPEHKIAYLPRKNNWWGPAGITGPCGPDTEMFFWRGETEFPPENSNPGTDEDNWLEIWNDVFMQYFKKEDGTYEPLKQKNVDTGMGLERTLVVLNGLNDVFQIDTFWPIIEKIQEISGHKYNENPEITKAMRVVGDHLRTATVIMGDNHKISPSNVDQGYIVRRLIRRAIRHGRDLGITENFCAKISAEVVKIFANIYPEIGHNQEFVLSEMDKEETKFRNTLISGERILEKAYKEQRNDELSKLIGVEKVDMSVDESMSEEYGKWQIDALLSGDTAFELYTSHGYPMELTEEFAKRMGFKGINKERFDELFKHHQELSRAGAEQKFKGGLADTSEMSTKYHTATHLLHAALRAVLGTHVEQRGSNITADRLRFDFSHPAKMTDEEKKRVEDLVNYAISQDYPVSFEEMTVPEAKELGAMGLFEDKYGNKVKVYSIGDPKQKPVAAENVATFSKEICGGPHATQTGTLGKFKIVKEEAVSAGIRRIKAVLE